MVDVGRERYGLTWPGKADCFKTIQAPSLGTLRPARDESVNFDTTENLIIEGDNLEVLKLLQKSYLGKVKMIYIDPPYNTGKDFIYPDNFGENLQTYLEYTGQLDSEGRKFSTNTETEGRFHSKWLNMVYPRLYLARNLLSDDGMVAISVDDTELQNLRRLCDEVFGEDNFAAQIAVVHNLKGRNDRKHVATCHEYLVLYCKSDQAELGGLPLTEEQRAEYKFEDERGEKYALRDLRKRGRPDRREDRPKMWFPIFWNETTRKCSLTRTTTSDIEITPLRGDGTDGRWRWGKERVEANLAILEPRKSKKSDKWEVEHRVYLNATAASEVEDDEDEADEATERSSKSKSFWIGGELSTDTARRTLLELLPDCGFDYPKSVELLKRVLNVASDQNSIVLDFFAGSGTTGHAVLELNHQDGGNRKFILVQLPEPTDNLPLRTISEITKGRIRKVIERQTAADADKLDLAHGIGGSLGFRVFKLDQSNFTGWDAEASKDAEALGKQLEMGIDHVRQGRSEDDLLYELLLKSGFPLTTPVEKLSLAGKTVFSIGGGVFLICLERELNSEVIKAMAEMKPSRVVCIDDGFRGNDQLKTNAVLTFKAKGVAKFQTV